jgi:ABC-2 type transport system permease protein
MVETSFSYTQEASLIGKSVDAINSLNFAKEKYTKEPTNDNLYAIHLYTLDTELESITNELTMYTNGWQQSFIDNIKENNNRLAALEMIKDGIKADSFKYGKIYLNYTDEEISEEYDATILLNQKDIALLKTDSYYEYQKIEIDNLKEQNKILKEEKQDSSKNNDLIRIKQYIVDKKIKYDNDVRVVNQAKLESLMDIKIYDHFTEKEFNKSYDLKHTYKTYRNYNESVNATNKFVKKEYKRLWYAMENSVELSNGTKDSIENFYQIIFIIALGSVICYAGIVSREFKSGSIRMLLTQGPKRYKILLSKYTMMILSTYLIYFICFFGYMFLILRKGSLSELTDQLVLFNGSPILINYFLYLFVMLLIYSLPIIFIMTLVFLITTINNGVVLGTITGVILSALSIISISLIYIIDMFKLYFLKYIPLSYMNLYFYDPEYTGYNNVSFIFNIEIGSIMLFISIILMYLIAHFIFTRRDVRN